MQISAKKITYKAKCTLVLVNEASAKSGNLRKLTNASKVYFGFVERYRQVV